MKKPVQQKKKAAPKKAAGKAVKKHPKVHVAARSPAVKKMPQIAAPAKPEKQQTKPKIEIDLQEVERLAGLGLTNEEIAISLNIGERTFYDRKKESADFAGAIKRGQLKAAEKVSNALFQLCEAQNLGAIIWFEKTRRGLSDKFSLNIDVTKLSDEELDAYIKNLRG